MTQEQKQIKLAEVQGILSHDKHGPLFHTKTGYVRDCPDYFNDLNAVHELEEKLDDSQKILYVAKLSQILSPSKFPQSFRILHATAEQRCEALGLTLNLW
jgi:hypothetical protein